MIQGLINKVIPFSSVDGPGNRTAIFLQGCNFNCIYCHNPETINVCESCGSCIGECPVQALKQEITHQEDIESNALRTTSSGGGRSKSCLAEKNQEITWDKDNCQECDACIKKCHRDSSPKVLKLTADQILEGIMPYKAFIQGITVSGGECTLQETFLIELFKKAKVLGLTCYIDTNGSKDFQQMTELLELTDGVMLDVKVWDEATHKKYIGMTNETVLKNLTYLKEKGKLYEVRTVVVPEVFENEETVDNTARIISGSEIRYKLIRYRPLGVREEAKDLQVPSTRVMKELEVRAMNKGCKDIIIV